MGRKDEEAVPSRAYVSRGVFDAWINHAQRPSGRPPAINHLPGAPPSALRGETHPVTDQPDAVVAVAGRQCPGEGLTASAFLSTLRSLDKPIACTPRRQQPSILPYY